MLASCPGIEGQLFNLRIHGAQTPTLAWSLSMNAPSNSALKCLCYFVLSPPGFLHQGRQILAQVGRREKLRGALPISSFASSPGLGLMEPTRVLCIFSQ